VHSVRMTAFRNVMPGFGRPADAEPPPGLDWDLWLGPAPQRRYNPNRCLYHFRWFWDYSGGQMTNLGAHALDVVHWFLDAAGPRRVPLTGPAPPRTRAVEDNSGSSARQLRQHVRNFLDCVKSRRAPVSDLESAHRVATACHLANLSLRLGRKLRWDADREEVL